MPAVNWSRLRRYMRATPELRKPAAGGSGSPGCACLDHGRRARIHVATLVDQAAGHTRPTGYLKVRNPPDRGVYARTR